MARFGLGRRLGRGEVVVWIRASPAVSLRSSASPSQSEGEGLAVVFWRLFLLIQIALGVFFLRRLNRADDPY